jgi:hypothetical protein
MSVSSLSQADADFLLALQKQRFDDTAYEFPGLGGSIRIPLVSSDQREHFYLDVAKGSINLAKGKYQARARQSLILARLDFGGAPHRNPDDEEVACPHLHVYREGYGDKWAFPVPEDKFPNLGDNWGLLSDFMSFVNIVHPPIINRGLFT